MRLHEGSQIVPTIWTEEQQFTVIHVNRDCEVFVQSNVQPLSLILYPAEYRVGVSLEKWIR